MRQGHGTFTYKNGNVYVGEWVNFQRHGKGKLTFANGNKQEGRWENGKFLEHDAKSLNQSPVQHSPKSNYIALTYIVGVFILLYLIY